MGFSNKAAKAQQAAAAQAAKAEEERQRKEREKEQAKRDREQSYGARGQRLSSTLGKDTAYSKGKADEEEKSNKLGNTSMNYNLLNVKLG